ncbi:hypothetical protein BC829DRAFT_259499 [Chytridium lagenaria]|nr:hypothetical protein BC829DRAFT_259499 [Chytridium lagenaria]
MGVCSGRHGALTSTSGLGCINSSGPVTMKMDDNKLAIMINQRELPRPSSQRRDIKTGRHHPKRMHPNKVTRDSIVDAHAFILRHGDDSRVIGSPSNTHYRSGSSIHTRWGKKDTSNLGFDVPNNNGTLNGTSCKEKLLGPRKCHSTRSVEIPSWHGSTRLHAHAR